MAARISAEYASRLRRLASNELTCAILIIRGPEASLAGRRRLSPAERRERVDMMGNAAVLTVRAVDAILEKLGGERLSVEVGPIGAVVVKATPDVIFALADLPDLEAIVEDQPVRLVEPIRVGV